MTKNSVLLASLGAVLFAGLIVGFGYGIVTVPNGLYFGIQKTNGNILTRLADNVETSGSIHGTISEDPQHVLDAWKNPVVYERHENGWSITSFGADGKPGGIGLATDMIVTGRDDEYITHFQRDRKTWPTIGQVVWIPLFRYYLLMGLCGGALVFFPLLQSFRLGEASDGKSPWISPHHVIGTLEFMECFSLFTCFLAAAATLYFGLYVLMADPRFMDFLYVFTGAAIGSLTAAFCFLIATVFVGIRWICYRYAKFQAVPRGVVAERFYWITMVPAAMAFFIFLSMAITRR